MAIPASNGQPLTAAQNQELDIIVQRIKKDGCDPSLEMKDFVVQQAALSDANGNAYAAGDDKLLRELTKFYLFECRDIDLGVAVSWDETKCCPLKCRRCHGHCYARVCHPSIGEIWGDVENAYRCRRHRNPVSHLGKSRSGHTGLQSRLIQLFGDKRAPLGK